MNGNGSHHSHASVKVPVLGEAFAGKPIPVEALPITHWREIRPVFGARLTDRFASARVNGDSMIEDGINNGDYIIFLLTHEARAGELAIVLTPDGLTLKYVHPQSNGMVILRGANSAYEDQVWEACQLKVQGVVKRIERDL